ncbi:MAG: glycoside hydrolase N-terminal domain-containing protein [Verrucomicrobiota bacterium JB022]|nr:glycoside hydrolase N-terminal domain-containing protein [Verrucomicrobiota bacterium JB022]
MSFSRNSVRAVLLGCSFAASLSAGPLSFFLNSPATYSSSQTSNEALPIGNGKLAALIYGGTSQEIIQFNEDTVWAGTVNDYSQPGAVDWLDDIREYVWKGEGVNAWNLAARDNFMSIPLRQSPYQPAGNLRLNFNHGSTSDYKRALDLETGTTSVQYTSGGVTYTREMFASYPDQVIVVRLTASQPGSLTFSYGLDTQHTRSSVSTEGNQLVLDAQVNVDVDTRRNQTSDVHFQSRVRILNDGGTVTPSGNSISVAGANSVTLIMSVASNVESFDDLSADPEARTLAVLNAIDGKNYDAIRADHLEDFEELFDRVSLDLDGPSKDNLPIDQRLDAIDASANTEAARVAALSQDVNLVELSLQMGRYMLITGSRAGSQPLNLQGKWNNELNPSWESKMTLNINQEMNYWLAEIGNLSETHVPMVDLVRDLTESGQKVAERHYGADGWMVHHNTDLWRGAAPINNPGGLWPSGGAWLSMHLWWHYQYSKDPAILQEIYPLMKGATLFFDDFLVEDPREGYNSWLVTNPTHSPEQPQTGLGDEGEIVAGTTMDNQLIRGLYNYMIEASEILDVDADLRAQWISNRDRLPPNMIGRFGQLQEWLEDVDSPNDQHRHLSPLVAMFPGDEITPQHTPEFAEAVKVSLDRKGDGTNNTSWSQAWKMCLRTSMGEGDHAFRILANLFAKSHTDNMVFSRKGGENQIDGNMGSAAGVAQMFLQSDRGEIELLPALPSALASGSVKGLKARGGYEVDITWENGAMTEATIHAVDSGTARVRSATPLNVKLDGNLVSAPEVETGVYQFNAIAGQTYAVAAGEPYSGPIDSDNDGLLDSVETNTGVYVSPTDTGTDPLKADTDGDGIEDGVEITMYSTDPTEADTDGDGIDDGVEVALASLGFDPLVDSSSLMAVLQANAQAVGLYTREQLEALAAAPLIAVQDGKIVLDLSLVASADAENWQPVNLSASDVSVQDGDVRIEQPAPSGVQFYYWSPASVD